MLKDEGEKSAQKQQPMLLTGGMYHQYQRREQVLPNLTARPPRPPANQRPPKKARPPPAACSSSNSSSASTLPAQSPPALTSQPSSAGRPNVQQSMCRVWPQQQKVQDGGHHKVDENSSAASESSVTIVHAWEEPREAEEFSGNSTAELGDHLPAGDGGLLFGPMQLARAHWIQLHKTGMQLPVLRRMFLQLLQQNAQLRALWPFARHFDGSATRLEQLVQAPAFRHFCQSYQAAITMLMDNLDDEPALSRLLQEMGSNHFFYDCIESHIKLMRDEFFRTLVDCLAGTSEELDEDLAEDWEKLWAKLQSNMGFGLKVQRHNYLAHCVTGQEMSAMRAQWSRLCEAITGIGQLAKNIGGTGAEAFLEGLTAIGLDGSRAEQRTLFIRASHELIWAMEKAVTLWEPGTGFLRVCAEIEDKCLAAGELIQRVGAPLVRRPFIEAFSGELAALDGQKGGDEQKQKDAVEATATLHSWTKLYRVAEQAIVASQLEAK